MIGAGLHDLIATAYEGACRQSGMQVFVAAAADYFGADRAAIGIWPDRDPARIIAIRHAFDRDDFDRLFADRIEPGALFTRLGQMAQGELIDSSEGAELLRSGGCLPADGSLLAAVVHASGPNRCAIILVRDATGATFSKADRDTLHQVITYMARAIDINRGFIRTHADLSAARLILDTVPNGIAVLGQNQQLTYVNDEAARIFDLDAGITRHESMLQISDPTGQASLQTFLAEEATTGNGSNHGNPAEPAHRIGLSIPRTDSDGHFHMVVFRVGGHGGRAALDDDHAMAVVTLTDPMHTRVPPRDLLVAFYHLSPAEAELTRSLAQGLSLQDAADALHISVNTARTQLRSIFRKVGVGSQVGLIQQISQNLNVNHL